MVTLRDFIADAIPHGSADTRSARAARARALFDPSEELIQRTVVAFLTLLGEPGLVFTHPANGELRKKSTGGKLKAMGQRPGIPDLLLWHQGKSYALELKRLKGRVSPLQAECLAALKAAGVEVAVAYGEDAALDQLRAWGLLKTNRVDGALPVARPPIATHIRAHDGKSLSSVAR